MVIQRNFRKYVEHRDWAWFMLVQKTRPLIGLVNVEEELRVLEEQANEAYGHYQEQLSTKAQLEQENVDLATELTDMKSKLMAEQGDLVGAQERLAKLSAQKADLEAQLDEGRAHLERTERERAQLAEGKKGAEREKEAVKREVQVSAMEHSAHLHCASRISQISILLSPIP